MPCPEQARGLPVDKRTDIWAFGCVLYELLARRAAFSGATIPDTIAAILDREPDWTALTVATPASVARVLRRCFEKNPKQRLRDIGDARLELQELSISETPSSAPTPTAWRRQMNRWTAGVLVAGAAGGLGYYGAHQSRPSGVGAAPTRFSVELPLAAPLLNRGPVNRVLALSPDGRHLAFFARQAGQIAQLWVHSLDRLESRPIAGTEGAFDPFFSPDGRWIGFFQGHQINKVLVTGGEPLTICDIPSLDAAGASWAVDDTIFFTPSPKSGLWRVPAAGGVPSPALTDNDVEYRSPQVLPNGKVVLFTSPDPVSPTPELYIAAHLTSVRTHNTSLNQPPPVRHCERQRPLPAGLSSSTAHPSPPSLPITHRRDLARQLHARRPGVLR